MKQFISEKLNVGDIVTTGNHKYKVVSVREVPTLTEIKTDGRYIYGTQPVFRFEPVN